MTDTKKEVPSFNEYISSINKYLTHFSDHFYIKFQWISPSKAQIRNIYYVRKDGEEQYLKEFKVSHFFYSADELDISRNPGDKTSLFSATLIENKVELSPIKKIPYEIF